MAGAPRLSTVDQIVRSLKKVRKEMVDFAKNLPNEDAYATPYSILSDGVRHVDEVIDGLKESVKDAAAHRKQFPEQFPNRARKWCVINDSRRKPRSRAKDAASTDPETT